MAADQLDLFPKPEKPKRVLNAMEKLLAEKAAYMRTSKWKKRRKAKLDQTRGQCERCSSWTGRKDVHHKTYERLGNERLDDLIVLCTHCHEVEDERRAAEAKQRSAAALDDAIWESGLNTFGIKKYDEDWYITPGYDIVAEEYAEWLERRQERDDYYG
jgi:hypothetical protein